MSPAHKLHTLPDLARELEARRAAGARIIFTNGVFELLHVGHVRMLEAARALGDCLVVAVNGDASVRASRGAGPPLVPARERAELLAALAAVDYVLVFQERDVAALLERLRPHVHAKGRDYSRQTLPERAVNERLGIEMAFVGDEKQHFASALVRGAGARTPEVDELVADTRADRKGYVDKRRRDALSQAGWLDLARLLRTQDGEIVERGTRRFVRRLVMLGRTVYLKVTHPLERKRSAILELQHNLALRAAGFRAARPWLALEGATPDGRVGALVLAESAGVALDAWCSGVLPTLPPPEQRAAARGLGLALRALHTARFFPRDLTAWHILVDGTPAAAQRDLVFLDLMRLERGGARLSPAQAARGLAALSLSLGELVSRRLLLRALRAYLGGTLRGARPWLRRITRTQDRLRSKSTFRPRPRPGAACGGGPAGSV